MAEILLSLTIIGVVAAITLPSLTGNINERTWNTQRIALYARFSQAIALMPALNGYGTLTEDADGNITTDTAAETFITEGLAKVLKINNICDHEHIQDCGIPTKITALDGTIPYSAYSTGLPDNLFNFNAAFSDVSGNQNTHNYSQVNTKIAAFETVNGESIAVYYYPRCSATISNTPWGSTQNEMCANFIYDLNGNKGPNTVGKDIGVITVLGSVDPIVVSPYPFSRDTAYVAQDAGVSECTKFDPEYRIPNREELASIYYNYKLFAMGLGAHWSSSLWSSGNDGLKAWGVDGQFRKFYNLRTIPYAIRCIKR